MTARGLQEREGIKAIDLNFTLPVDLQEEQKAVDGVNGQLLKNNLHKRWARKSRGSDSITVELGISKKLLENIWEDPTDDLLDAIQNSINADRLAVKSTATEIQVSTYDSDSSNVASNLQYLFVETEEGVAQLREEEEADYILLQEVLLADDVAITKVDRSFSPEFATIRNKKAGIIEEKDLRREENLNAKNAKKGKLSSQVRVKGQKFRKSA